MLTRDVILLAMISAVCTVLVKHAVEAGISWLRERYEHDFDGNGNREPDLSVLERRSAHGCPCDRKQPDPNPGRLRSSDPKPLLPLTA